MRKITVCARCLSPVSFAGVSKGYYAVCLKQDEDLYQFETRQEYKWTVNF